MKALIFTLALLVTQTAYAIQDVAQHLQDVSVTIRAGRSEGSGVLVTRKIKPKADSKQKVDVNFVVTCAHVVDGLRSTRTVVEDGKTKTIVEFKDAKVIKELIEKGRKVGELTMDAKVILYSDATEGEDLAVLMVRKRGFVDANTEFDLSGDPVKIGTQLYHVGSLLGQSGANSMTTGIMSQVGRVLDLGSGEGTVFDQTTVTAFPGSSGGGVFLTNGKYIGMLVRGAGETFNLTVPVRRMQDWVKDRDCQWVLDPSKEAPTLDEIDKIEAESRSGNGLGPEPDPNTKQYPFLIRDMDKKLELKERSSSVSEYQKQQAIANYFNRMNRNVGYRPVITWLPQGTSMGVSATVSPNRRYVRIGVNAGFSQITGVNTFTYYGGR
jgi:hypothetical protein